MRPPCRAHPQLPSPAKRPMSLYPERDPSEGELPGLEEKGMHTAAAPRRGLGEQHPAPRTGQPGCLKLTLSSPASLPSKQTPG